jgi:hypothetical protein
MIKMINKYLGRGEFSITVPPMDGALMPNKLLEETEKLLIVDAPDCLALMNGVPVVSSHSKVLEVDKGGKEVAQFDAEISCMAGLPDGGLAVGLVDGRIAIVNGKNAGKIIQLDKEIKCPTVLLAESGSSILVANGTSKYPYNEWKRDLMEINSLGSIWRVEISSGQQTKICKDIAFPYGLCSDGKSLFYSESWKSRIMKISLDGSLKEPEEVLSHFPGYVSRFVPAQGGGIWLTVFAPRSQLIEFVLRENRYRKLMMENINPDFWVAPTLRSNKSLYEPLQAGAVKQLGVLKPWAPARSYGLVIRLDSNFQPIASLHSRADGTRHGITSCIEHNGQLLLAVKGDGMVASYPIDRIEKGK